jgi:hypothetical protein
MVNGLCDRTESPVDDGNIVAALDHDEALLSVLHTAADNPALLPRSP